MFVRMQKSWDEELECCNKNTDFQFRLPNYQWLLIRLKSDLFHTWSLYQSINLCTAVLYMEVLRLSRYSPVPNWSNQQDVDYCRTRTVHDQQVFPDRWQRICLWRCNKLDIYFKLCAWHINWHGLEARFYLNSFYDKRHLKMLSRPLKYELHLPGKFSRQDNRNLKVYKH